MSRNLFPKIYAVVKKIPKGKVTTYKEIARLTRTNPQVVGWALHCNQNPKVPCHRVVDIFGHLHGFARGLEEKRKLLEKEGIKVKNFKVDLGRYLWKP